MGQIMIIRTHTPIRTTDIMDIAMASTATTISTTTKTVTMGMESLTHMTTITITITPMPTTIRTVMITPILTICVVSFFTSLP